MVTPVDHAAYLRAPCEKVFCSRRQFFIDTHVDFDLVPGKRVCQLFQQNFEILRLFSARGGYG